MKGAGIIHSSKNSGDTPPLGIKARNASLPNNSRKDDFFKNKLESLVHSFARKVIL